MRLVSNARRGLVLLVIGVIALAGGALVSLSSASATTPTWGSAIPQLAHSDSAMHGGSGWQQVFSYPTITGESNISCPSASDCFLAGNDASDNGVALASSDSGQSWSALSLPPGTQGLSAIACPPPSTSTCYLLGQIDGDTAILSTTDSGVTWSNLTLPAGIRSLNGIACPSETSCYVAGVDGPMFGSVVFATTDSGNTWQVQAMPSGFDTSDDIACPSTSTCYVVANSDGHDMETVAATTDSGATWSSQNLPSSAVTLFGSPIACTSTTTCYIDAWQFSSDFKVIATTNSGTTWNWQAQKKGTGEPLSAIACSSASTCYGVGETGTYGEAPGSAEVVVGGSGGTWSDQIVPSGVGPLYSISCPSASTCFAVGGQTGSSGAVVLEGSALSITSTSLPSGLIGSAYSATLSATGGDPPYQWRMAPGSPKLPKGLKLGASGTIAGKPSKSSVSSTFTVEVEDAKSKGHPAVQNTASASFTISISSP